MARCQTLEDLVCHCHGGVRVNGDCEPHFQSASCGTHIKIRVCGSARAHILAVTRMACKRMPTRASMASRESLVVSTSILNFCVLQCTEQLSSKGVSRSIIRKEIELIQVKLRLIQKLICEDT